VHLFGEQGLLFALIMVVLRKLELGTSHD